MRGSLLYCTEGTDNPGLDLDLVLPAEAALSAEFQPDMLGGVVALHGRAQVVPPETANSSFANRVK